MRLLAPDIPPHVADVIRRLPPDVKHSVKQAIRALRIVAVGHRAVICDELSQAARRSVKRK